VIDSGSGEQCDDGNTTSGDGCTAACIDEFCGDGVVNDDGAETCDDGNTTSGDGCTATCADEFCGDGVINDDGVEECDDGNATSGDGCTDTCIDEFCGDGVVNDNGTEQCDDGPANSDTTPGACRTNCRNPGCGDGIIDLGEQCDDANNASGDCCGATCQYDVLGTPCPGSSGVCVAPACDGAGACLQLPANEGTPCEDDDLCTASSTCQSGACATAEYSGVGAACNYVVVGAPWIPSQPNKATLLKSLSGMQSVGGDWCGLRGDFATNSVFSGDIIATKDDLDGLAIRFAAFVNVSGGDIVTGGKQVTSTGAAINLPGLATNTVAGGLFVPKTPSPTFYDTTGTDPRVAECEAAQNGIAATKAVLDALPQTFDYGSAYKDLPGFTNAAPIVATNVGGLNVFDMTHLSGDSTNVTVTLDGGGSPDTVMVLRISTRFNTGESWTFNLTGDLTPDHLIFYVSKNAGGIEGCAVGIGNVGGGTLFCPDMQAKILAGTTWSGAIYGGDSGTDGEIRVEQSTLIYTPFTAALP
jgi:cysteine-rich repeat protein